MKGILRNQLTPLIKHLRSRIVIKDAGNKRIKIDRTIDLVVHLGIRVQTVHFYVIDSFPQTSSSDVNFATSMSKQSDRTGV